MSCTACPRVRVCSSWLCTPNVSGRIGGTTVASFPRSLLAVALGVLALTLLGCTGGPGRSSPAAPDPRIDGLQAGLAAVQGRLNEIDRQLAKLQTPTPSSTASAAATATPDARPTPATATPPPNPTPGPPPADVEAVIQSEREQAPTDAAAAAAPTATPLPATAAIATPTAVAVAPQVTGPLRVNVYRNVDLIIEPGQPLAGRDIAFTLQGLDAWQPVTIEFVDPNGKPAEWARWDEAHFPRTDGLPVTELTLHADSEGMARWSRVATLDSEGIWSLRINSYDRTDTVSYPLTQLQQPAAELVSNGVDFRMVQGLVSDSYASALVPAALALDLQSHLAWVATRLSEGYGLQSSVIPDIYLTGNRGILEQASRAIGVVLGFEDGYFISRGDRPAIYMRTDSWRTSVERLLTHEYVHLTLSKLEGNTPLPTWLEEGLAVYIEHELGLLSTEPDIARRSLYSSAITAVDAARVRSLTSEGTRKQGFVECSA